MTFGAVGGLFACPTCIRPIPGYNPYFGTFGAIPPIPGFNPFIGTFGAIPPIPPYNPFWPGICPTCL